MQTQNDIDWLAALAVPPVIFSLFLPLGRAPLFDVDEGAFSQATMEMFERGDYLSTYLNGVPRYDKPILVYWLQAAAGLGVMAKGPVALLIPGAVTFLFCLLRRDLKTWLRMILDWRGILQPGL